ncbi:MAG: immunoglobulin domain-containing protein [Verrucomicrobiota bacterium]
MAGKTYTLHLLTSGKSGKGRASATVRLPDRVNVTFTAQRTAQDTRVGSVSATDGEKEIAPVGVNAFPKPEKNGQIAGVTYTIANDNPRVSTHIQNSVVLASTSYSETQRQPWSSMESGSASVTPGEEAKFIAQSTLAAPNADTLWTVTDDNPRVETWIVENRLYARVLTAPTIVTQPQSQAVTAGVDVTFTVTANGSAPLAYEWRKGSATIAGETNATLALANVQLTDAGSYSVVVSNSAGSTPSAVAVLTVTTNSTTAFVLRQLPSGYIPGAVLTVQLTATPSAGTQAYAIEDMPPVSWPVSAISDGGVFDASSGRVKFGPFFDATSRTVSYQLTAPTNPTGRVTFSGTASADGVDSVIGGASEIGPVLAHPADLNTDFRLVISEVTGYGATWKRSQTWTNPPNPIPIGYVTRAGYLWKNGERYRYDTNDGPAPLCWVIAPAGQAAGLVAVSLHAISASTAVCAISGTNVTLSITPASTVAAYAVQDELPEDFTAAGVSGGGTFDTATRQVKWGPFFDSQARVFTYALVPPTGFLGTAVLIGVASFDGLDMTITGDRQYTQGGTPPISQVSRTISTNGGTANITLAAAPASTVAAYAVEETVPANFTVDNINESGAFDPGTRKVKWGPFFDNTARLLSYRLTAPPGFSGTATIAGVGSFDGTDIPTTGQSQFDIGSGPEQPEYQAAMYGGLVIERTVGAQYRIDYASSLNEPVQWIPLQTITLTNSPQRWADLESLGQSKRFYRVVAVP